MPPFLSSRTLSLLPALLAVFAVCLFGTGLPVHNNGMLIAGGVSLGLSWLSFRLIQEYGKKKDSTPPAAASAPATREVEVSDPSGGVSAPAAAPLPAATSDGPDLEMKFNQTMPGGKTANLCLVRKNGKYTMRGWGMTASKINAVKDQYLPWLNTCVEKFCAEAGDELHAEISRKDEKLSFVLVKTTTMPGFAKTGW